VTGVIQFRKPSGREEYLPVMVLRSLKDIQPDTPDLNPYIQ
jgi:hypothetical protein